MKKKTVIGLLLVAVSVIGIGVFLNANSATSGQFHTIKKGAIVDAVYGIGTLSAKQSLEIKSGVTTNVSRFYVNEGDSVKAGEKLVRLEGVGDFIAPFSGVVTSIPLKQGETVFAQTAIMVLTDVNDLYLSVAIEQGGALKIKSGMPVRISFDGLRDKYFTGKVESIYASGADFLARISVSGLTPEILPGMSADVAIMLNEKKDALVVPVAAIENGQLNIRRDSKVIKVAVETGLSDGATIEITKGDLREGDEAILASQRKAP